MPRKQKATRSNDMLSRHYRAIGPAAIMAALICCKRRQEKSGATTA
ncbi:MAG: hypothetical protein R3D45_06075 [Rhizobiaceae bacterium]